MKKYHVVVIGGGAAGLTVAIGAAMLGADVALIEKEQEPGGDCLNYGCVPSKALLAAAKNVHQASVAAQRFGLQLSGVPDWGAVKEGVAAAIAQLQVHDSTQSLTALGIDVFRGRGRFLDAHQVEVIESGQVLYGKRIVIAVGATPVLPSIEGIDHVGPLTNETLLKIKEVPRRLLVLGAGPVGMELGQAMARLGSLVTVVEAAEGILPREEPEIGDYLQQALEKELDFQVGTQVKSVQRTPAGEILVQASCGDTAVHLEGDALLVAVGRQPAIFDLGLERAGVAVKNGCVRVKETLQTSVRHIYAVGDVIGYYPFTHAAGQEGRLVIYNAILGLKKRIDYRNVPWCVYTDPEVFHLGLTEAEARERYGRDVQVRRIDASQVDRFVAEGDQTGLMKVISNGRGRILGAHGVATNAGDWMQEIVYAKQYGFKFESLVDVVHPYPSRSEMLRNLADQSWQERVFSGALRALAAKYVRWFR